MYHCCLLANEHAVLVTGPGQEMQVMFKNTSSRHDFVYGIFILMTAGFSDTFAGDNSSAYDNTIPYFCHVTYQTTCAIRHPTFTAVTMHLVLVRIIPACLVVQEEEAKKKMATAQEGLAAAHKEVEAERDRFKKVIQELKKKLDR